MKLLNVPHYRQSTNDECQAACAAMVIDYWARRADGGNPERLAALLDEFSFGFRPESGDVPPAITGLVAMAIARRGFSVDFYSKNPDGGGEEGLDFLKNGWDFTQDDVERYAQHAKGTLSDVAKAGFTIHEKPIREEDVVAAIAAGKPVVTIVDLEVLKDGGKSANHAVVVTGIEDDVVAIQDPAGEEPHRRYDRQKFFAAHARKETDCDAYIAAAQDSFWFECWNLDGHVLAKINGKEYVIDTGSPHTYVREGSVSIGGRRIEGHPPPPELMDALLRNVAPNIAGLIGLDVLSDYDVHISIPRRSIVFHEEEYVLPGSVPVEVERLVQGVPVLGQLRVNGRMFDALFDLGARFSYLAIDENDSGKNFGSAWDFWPANPAIDRFPVRLHNVTLRISDRDCPMTAGDRADVAGLPDIEIIGSEILKYFDINIALRRGLVELQPVPGRSAPAFEA